MAWGRRSYFTLPGVNAELSIAIPAGARFASPRSSPPSDSPPAVRLALTWTQEPRPIGLEPNPYGRLLGTISGRQGRSHRGEAAQLTSWDGHLAVDAAFGSIRHDDDAGRCGMSEQPITFRTVWCRRPRRHSRRARSVRQARAPLVDHPATKDTADSSIASRRGDSRHAARADQDGGHTCSRACSGRKSAPRDRS
jgi:hypothetical protein